MLIYQSRDSGIYVVPSVYKTKADQDKTSVMIEQSGMEIGGCSTKP